MTTEIQPQPERRRYVLDDGENYIGIGAKGLLAASEKLLHVNRGNEPDDRDSIRFKRVHGTHDMVREHITRDAGKLRRQLMYRVAKTKTLAPLHPGYFSGYIDGQFIGNPLSSPLEEINPMHIIENSRRMTLMGPGGIGSPDAITEEAQAVPADSFGFLSPIESPESERAGIDSRFAWGVKLGSDGRMYQLFRDKRSGKLRYMSPEDLEGLVVGLPD